MTFRAIRLGSVLATILAVAIPASAQINDLKRCTIFDGGPAVASVSPRGDEVLVDLRNNVILAHWYIFHGVMRSTVAFFGNLQQPRSTTGPTTMGTELFRLAFADGTVVSSSSLKVLGMPRPERLTSNPKASRLAERLPGQQVVVDFNGPSGSRITWRAILRDGANYIRQQVVITPDKEDLQIRRVEFAQALTGSSAVVSGTVAGSPIVVDDTFMGVEHPMSECAIEEVHSGAYHLPGDAAVHPPSASVHCGLTRDVPVRVGQTFTVSAVIGIAPPGQMRRAFLQYLERERAHPYRTFLHYNSWYDIGYGNKYDEKSALDVVNSFGQELTVKRSVKLDSLLFDDGWDNPESLWDFNEGFPQGFSRVKEAAAKYGTEPGVWMSPWGGYSEAKKTRIAFGQKQGYEINKGGFALSGPVYFQRFRDVCMNMIRQYGANMFKFDGTGRALGTVPGSRFGNDFEAAIQLIDDLRVEKPDIFINLTTGTWPSPFWLQYADSIWRGGSDHDFVKAEVGSMRQRWITYRDADTYRGIVQKGPLYPLSSLMLHGLIYAQHAKGLSTDPQGDFTAEIHDYFGTGTELQEMYVTPSLLTEDNWDTLAEAAKWSRANADVLFDTHWVGGDPGKFEVYGWASWTPAKAILVLRNPGDRPAQFTIDIAKAFELPAGAPVRYRAHSPWRADRDMPPVDLTAGQPHTFDLKPFEVLTLGVVPVRGSSE